MVHNGKNQTKNKKYIFAFLNSPNLSLIYPMAKISLS